MREFMHYITNNFFSATGWNEDNSYKELNATARELIDFDLPRGLRLTLSSLATPNFATSYQLGSVGIVDGSISYLYSSLPLRTVAAQSETIPLPTLLRSYRQLNHLGLRARHGGSGWGFGATPTATCGDSVSSAAQPTRDGLYRDTLLYGRLYLPQSLLEGMVVKRFSQALQVQLSAVSEQSLRNGGTVLGLLQYDEGKYGVEGLLSTDGGLLGVRGLYNFGGDASPSTIPPPSKTTDESTSAQLSEKEKERIYGRFSAGGELYYGTLNKSGGVSLGMRFATLPAHRGTPLTATLTINPLMGNISTTYAVIARQYCTLATRMEFNVYSYESEWAIGTELWSKRRPAGFPLGAENEVGSGQTGVAIQTRSKPRERSFQAKMEWRLDDPPLGDADDKALLSAVEQTSEGERDEGDYLGVLKARLDQNLRVGLLWEGRVQSLIFSLGTSVDLRRLGEPFRSLGLEIQYSS